MKLKFTLLMTAMLCLLGSDLLAQRVAGSSTSRSRPSSGGTRPSASRPSGGGGGSRSYTAPQPMRQPSHSASRPYSSSPSAAGDRPTYQKPPVSPAPIQSKPSYPTSTRPKPDYPTSQRPVSDGPRAYGQVDPIRSKPPVGGQLNPAGTLNGEASPTASKQENGTLPPDPNDGPAGQQMVTICMLVAGSTTGVNRTVTQERANELVASGQAFMGSCSGDISGTNGQSMTGSGSLPTGDPGGPVILNPSGTMTGTPVGPSGGGNGGGLNPSGNMTGSSTLPPIGGHHGGGSTGGTGCGPVGGYGPVGGNCGPGPSAGYGACPSPVIGFTWVGTHGGCQYNLCYRDLPATYTLYDITYCGPDRRTVILTSDCGTFHWKILERRYQSCRYDRNYGSRRMAEEWREVKRIRVDCLDGCVVCHR